MGRATSLSLGRSNHNDFQRGWAEVDASGEFMVTRRDGDGVELWRVASSNEEPLARLAQYPFWEPPDRVEFGEDAVSITRSNSIGSSGYRHESWALTPDALIETTCLLRGDGGASCPVADAEKPDGTTPTRAPTV